MVGTHNGGSQVTTPEDVKLFKKHLSEFLQDKGIVQGHFTGKLVLNFNCGSISDLEKTERIK